MNAEEARRITDSTLTQYEACLALIEDAAEHGQGHCFYSAPLNKACIDKLEALGYEIRNSEHQAEISW